MRTTSKTERLHLRAKVYQTGTVLEHPFKGHARRPILNVQNINKLDWTLRKHDGYAKRVSCARTDTSATNASLPCPLQFQRGCRQFLSGLRCCCRPLLLPVLTCEAARGESLLVSLGLLCSPPVGLNRRKSCPEATRSLEAVL
jgi:hypothetical protein